MTHPAGLVGLISNPSSGHNQSHFEQIAQRIERCDSIVHEITRCAEDIEPALHRLAQQQPSILAINGGDGTVSAVLAALLESKDFSRMPMIAVLPGGTANMTAGDIGVRGRLKKSSGKVL